MIADILSSALLYSGVSVGLAWPVARRLKLDASEQLTVSVALSLVAVYLISWTVYVTAVPSALLWVIPAATIGSLVAERRSLAALLQNSYVRTLIVGQAIVSSSCLGWLALVQNYSGGKLAADWFGHWQRSLFFLYHWPVEIKFNGFDPLPSRPPLANLITGAFMRFTTLDFAHYQLASTVMSSLAFLPAALLAHRFERGSPGDPPPGASTNRLVVLFILSPLFLQNATYSWTKLPAAFFALMAVYFFLRRADPDAPHCTGWMFGGALGAALLTHYSAGPYALVLAIAWFAFGYKEFRSKNWWRTTAMAFVAGTSVLTTWFAWSFAMYGAEGTFLSNTSVTDQAPTAVAQAWVVAMNIRDTLIPHFMRESAVVYFEQTSSWGFWRDWFFQLYQSNLYFAFGSVGGAAICAALWMRRRRETLGPAVFWTLFVGGVATLGIATHAGRESTGLAHISLQPLVLLGLAFLAARWRSLGEWWHRALVAGVTIDFFCGILLHFGTENHLFDRLLTPGRSLGDVFSSYSLFAQLNSRVKADVGWVFVGDLFKDHSWAVAGSLMLLLVIALVRAAHREPRLLCGRAPRAL